jgi:hypothetical protein
VKLLCCTFINFGHIIHLFSSLVFLLNFGDETQVIKTEPRIRNGERGRDRKRWKKISVDGNEGKECVIVSLVIWRTSCLCFGVIS